MVRMIIECSSGVNRVANPSPHHFDADRLLVFFMGLMRADLSLDEE